MEHSKLRGKLLIMLLVLIMVLGTLGMTANAQSEAASEFKQTEAAPDLQDLFVENIGEYVWQNDLVGNQGSSGESLKVTVSDDNIEGLDDTYDRQPTKMAEVQEAIDNYEATGIKAKWEIEVDAGIMPEGWSCAFVTDDEFGLSYWTFSPNTAELFAVPAGYTITEKYVNEDGNSIPGQRESRESIVGNRSYSKGIPAIDGYIVVGYRVGSLKADLLEGDTAQIKTVRNDTTVYFVYRKLSTTISVTYPAIGGMEFYVSEETYPYIKSDGESRSGYYTFTNKSDYPVIVSFSGMTIEADGGLEFVQDAASSDQGSNHISLSLVTPSGVSGNGFTNGVDHITPDSTYTAELGTLKGNYVSDLAATDPSGYITIGGHYAGYLGSEEKNLQLTFKFAFALVTG